jgi:hypothetical protein
LNITALKELIAVITSTHTKKGEKKGRIQVVSYLIFTMYNMLSNKEQYHFGEKKPTPENLKT